MPPTFKKEKKTFVWSDAVFSCFKTFGLQQPQFNNNNIKKVLDSKNLNFFLSSSSKSGKQRNFFVVEYFKKDKAELVNTSFKDCASWVGF